MWLITEKHSIEIKKEAQHLEVSLNQNILQLWPVGGMDTSRIDGAGVGELSGNVRTNGFFSGIFAVLLFCIVGLPLAQARWRRNTVANPATCLYLFMITLGGHKVQFEKYWFKLYFFCLLMSVSYGTKSKATLRLRYIAFIAFLLSIMCLALSAKAVRLVFDNLLL